MTLMRFDLSPYELQFSCGASYPASLPVKVFGVNDRTAAGTFQYEELGIQTFRRTLQFDRMPKVDYDGLVNWFLNVSEAGKNEFQFTDEYGLVGWVIITDQELFFQEIFLDTFSGSVNLEYTVSPI